MALVSPGISISINDQSQYINSNVGSVPLVVLATAQDKVYNGTAASGTTKASAGKLLSFTSQRDLVTQMGTPDFQLSSAGTPVNGSEVNEYGLMTAYSALGLTNQLYAIRADIDLAQLTGTSVRPIGAPANNTYWVDLVNTHWGLSALNATTSKFTDIAPLLITDSMQVSGVPATPLTSIGQVGQYALVFVNEDGTTVDTVALFYKTSVNSVAGSSQWVQVGSADWQTSVPTVTGTVANASNITASSTLTINNITITTGSTTTVAALADSINTAMNAYGVYAIVTTSGFLQLFVTSAATSNGSTVDGKLVVTDGTHTPLNKVGITAGSYFAPILFFGTYAQTPTTNAGGWFSTDPSPRPTGSVWWKTSSIGNGLSVSLKKFNSASDAFSSVSVPVFENPDTAIYGLDPAGGGVSIPAGQVIASYATANGTANGLQFYAKTRSQSSATGAAPDTSITGTFNISATTPGTSVTTSPVTITLSADTATTAVSMILEANIPYVTASITSSGAINISHTAGGDITLTPPLSGTSALGTDANDPGIGFYAGGGTGYEVSEATGYVYIECLTPITTLVDYSTSQPYAAPAAGTYWYYSNPTDLDIMVNDGTGWKGYRTVTRDVRGYNLQNTDPAGVIITPTTAPTSKSTGAQLSAGDLWLDSGDLVNFPALSRYNGTTWVKIDNTDHITSGGIVFADARWDTDGTTDIISGELPSIATMLTSSYLDLDAPDYRLYPRGTLLFNTRRSGYNIKKYVPNYFNSASYPNLPVPPVPGAPTALPTETSAWVSASGLNNSGVMNAGSAAQRALVVSAMQSAVDSNLDVLSPVVQFNLLVAPNYPELIPNLLALNDNRGDTAFVIGDTPMDLTPNVVDITNWVSNTSGTGLPSDASTSPYLALYYPAGLTNDLAGNQIVVPASHAVLRTYLYNDQVSYPWFAPAGLNRGLVSNLSSVGYVDSTSGLFVHNGINQGLRDALFTLNINPITQLPGSGLVIMGQLTRSGDTTSRNRVNVVRLENHLRTIFNSVSNGYLFEPNDAITRKSIASQIENALNNVLAHRGLYDFLVICDSSNNTAATISNNQLYVDVAIEPMKDVEFIYIPIAIYNPGSIAQLNTKST